MVREIVRGTYPPQLADFDLARALRARAARGPVDTSLEGPRLGTVTTISLPGPPGRMHTNDDDAPDILQEMCGRLVCGLCDRSKPGRLM